MPDVGFQRPTLQELIDRAQNDVNSNIDGADAKLRRSVLNVLSAVVSGQTHGLYGYLNYIAKQAIVSTADNDSLVLWSKVWNISRKPSTKAAGEIVFTGIDGSVIPAGTEVRRGDDAVYVVDQSVAIAAGQASVNVTAQASGLSGNTDAGTQISLLAAIAGVVSTGSVANAGLVAGADIESDAELLIRVLDRIQQPPHGGALFDYKKWALEVPGVTRAWPVSTELGAGTVTVRFMMDNTYSDGVPQAADVAIVQSYLDDEVRRPITTQVFALAPVSMPVDVTIQDLSPDTADVRKAVIDELADFIAREAEPGKTIPISKFWESVATASGEFSHKIIFPPDDVAMNVGEISRLGTVTFTVGGA